MKKEKTPQKQTRRIRKHKNYNTNTSKVSAGFRGEGSRWPPPPLPDILHLDTSAAQGPVKNIRSGSERGGPLYSKLNTRNKKSFVSPQTARLSVAFHFHFQSSSRLHIASSAAFHIFFWDVHFFSPH